MKSLLSCSQILMTITLVSAMAWPVVGQAEDVSLPPQRMKGMSQQIVVKKAADLNVVAPKGEYVAVLDQSAATKDPKMSKLQDHNNGWLDLSVKQVEGNTLNVRGLYYVPESTKNRPDGLRLTLRKRLKTGLFVLSDKTIKIAAANINQWIDFEIDLPLKDGASQPDGQLSLLLSATPLAGPVYLDMVDVTDASGKALWAYPSFE